MGVYDIIHSTNNEIKTESSSSHQDIVSADHVITTDVNKVSVKRLKIAYAVTITKDSSFIDGALVLG